MILCDLCGESTECLQKEIDGREYDICADCLHLLAEKLKRKGRAKQNRETVFLPPPSVPEHEPERPKPFPGGPPKIFGLGRTIRLLLLWLSTRDCEDSHAATNDEHGTVHSWQVSLMMKHPR
jgi:hypothetical protein